MTKFTFSALALVCVLLLAGCSTASRPGNCGCLEGNLCGWQFYKPADLVEGQDQCCRDLCRPAPCCAPGIPYSEAMVAAPEATADAAPAADAMTEAAPAAEGTAEFGLPAPTR